MTKPSKPCDIYVRVSRVGKREHLVSPEEQEQRARQLATEYGLAIGEVIPDLDQSGGKWERPGLQRALERVRAGVSGGLIVAWLDRLTRDSEHAHRILSELTLAGGQVYAPDAPADAQSPEGGLQLGILFAVAQYQRARIRERWASQQERAIASGILVGAATPAVGYRKRADRRLEPDPATAPIVRRAFELRASGVGVAGIARMFEQEGLRTSWGSTAWSAGAARSVLSNRVYLGELSFGRPPRYVNTKSHERLVDLPLWTAAQSPKGITPATTGGYLLSGLLRCAGCGYVMENTTERHGGYRIYRCRRRHAGGACRHPGYVAGHRVETALLAGFRRYLETLWTGVGDQVMTVPGPDLGPLQEALEVAERRLAAVRRPEMADAAGDDWPEMVRAAREDRDTAALALGHAQAQHGERIITPVERIAAWDAAGVADRRAAIVRAFPVVAYRKDEILLYPATESLPKVPQRGRRDEPPRALSDRR